MKRILIIHNQLWAHYKSKIFSELHRFSSDYNLEIRVAQIAISEKSRANMGNPNATAYDYPYDLLFNDSLENVRFWPKTKALFKGFNSYNPDILNITGYYDPAQVLLMLYAKFRGIKVVISNESNVRDGVRTGLKEILKKNILQLADGFICFGKSSVDYLEKLGIDSSKILTQKAAIVDDEILIENFQKGLLTRQQRKEELGLPKYNFMYVGRMSEEKNLRLLIETFGQLKAQDWGLILLGEGSQKIDLQILANQCTNIFFLDGVAWYDVPIGLALADVFLLPSLSEPWGLVVNEAMICAMPVVVSEVCGCVDDLVIEGKNGFIFNPNKQKKLTEILQYFIENPVKINEMGEASTQLVKPFSAEKVAKEILVGYQNLIASWPHELLVNRKPE